MARSLVLQDLSVTVGDTIKVHYSFSEKDKKKSQIFEGIVLAVRGRGDNQMVTIRKMTRSNIGVERIFPVISPFIEKVEIVKKTSSTRANIQYIRTRSKKDIKENLYRTSQV